MCYAISASKEINSNKNEIFHHKSRTKTKGTKLFCYVVKCLMRTDKSAYFFLTPSDAIQAKNEVP